MTTLACRDKLAEAEFFLQRLEETPPGAASFRFYFSALTSAARAISLVLQRDFRRKHRENFDTWWEDRRRSISRSDLPFERLVELRNALQKEGNLYPRRLEVIECEAGIVARYEIIRDAHHDDTEAARLVIHLRQDDPDVRIAVSSPATADEERTAHAIKLLRRAADELPVMSRTLASRSIIVDKSDTPVSVRDVTTAFRGYLDSMREVINEAEQRFPLAGKRA